VNRLAISFGISCALGATSVSASGLAPEARDAPILRTVLEKISSSYVEPSRVDPLKMLWAAANALDRDVPEVLLESRPGAETLTLRVSDERRTFPAAAVRSLRTLESTLEDILRFVGEHRAPPSKPNAEYVAINALLSTLDPHSLLLDQAQAREFATNLASRFFGIGIVFDSGGSGATGAGPGIPVIMEVMKGGPAEEAGIAACDRILAVEDRWAAGLEWQDLAGLLRGPAGSPVWVTLQRDGIPKDFVVTRAEIKVASVSSRRLDRDVGLIRINWFVKGTGGEVRSAIAELKKAGATSWIFDLRLNPGGLLSQAIETASVFVRSGPIVTVVGEGGRDREVKQAQRKPPGILEEGPLVVLIGPTTASAAEVLTAALQIRNRAAVLGRTSFGKGSVQFLYDQADGSKLKLTIAHYLTPGGASLQSLGITPDIELVPAPVPRPGRIRLTEPDPLQREADLNRAFAPREAARRPKVSLRYLAATPDGEEEVRIARDLLVDTRAETREAALVRGGSSLNERRDAEDAKIAAALTEAGVDWSSGSSKEPPRLTVRCAQRALQASDRVPVDCEVRNDGAGDAFRVYGRAKGSAFDLKQEEIVVGRVPAGASRNVTIEGSLTEDPSPRVSYVPFAFSEEGGAPVEGAPLRIETLQRVRPSTGAAPPRLDIFVEAGPRETTLDVQRVRATISGGGVRDAWVRISNQSAGLDRKKVTFQSRPPGGPPDRLELSSDVAVQPGLNQLGVCARGKDEERCETAFVFRLPANAP
jgi:carboxyl-terminal processing protease